MLSKMVVLNSCATDGFADRAGSIDPEMNLDILENVEIDIIQHKVNIDLRNPLELLVQVYFTKFIEELPSFLLVIRDVKHVSAIALIC